MLGNKILAPNILPQSLRNNARPLVDKADKELTQNAIDYLQKRTGINFMDELERARAKEILNTDFYSSGGGFGTTQGRKNYNIEQVLDELPPGIKFIAKNKGRRTSTYRDILNKVNDVINPINNISQTYRGLQNPSIISDTIRSLMTLGAVNAMPLQGGIQYNDHR